MPESLKKKAKRYTRIYYKRPHKIMAFIYDHGSYVNITLAGNSTAGIKPVVAYLRSIGVSEDNIYIDRYGWLRVVYKKLPPSFMYKVLDATEKYIGSIEQLTRLEKKHNVYVFV